MLTAKERRSREQAAEMVGAINGVTAAHQAIHDDLWALIRLSQERFEYEKGANRDAAKAEQKTDTTPIGSPPRFQSESANDGREHAAKKQDASLPWLNFWIQVALCVFTAGAFGAAAYYAYVAKDTLREIGQQTHSAEISANAAKSAADTAYASLVLQNRPWIKIEHRIVSPLRFNVGGRASGKRVAMMRIQDTLENVGPTVALNLFYWEDLIPQDADGSTRSADARQAQWCDANRKPIQAMTGAAVFPHQPFVGQSIVGPTMDRVLQAVVHTSGLNGKVAFVLVGCVAYRSSFEPKNTPSHQTRFKYYLGAFVGEEGGFNPFVFPSGIATNLKLIKTYDGYYAD